MASSSQSKPSILVTALKKYLRDAAINMPVAGDPSSDFDSWGRKFVGALVSAYCDRLIFYRISTKLFRKVRLEAQASYLPDVDIDSLVANVAVRFEASAGADADWLSWGSRLLPNHAREADRYQEQVAQKMNAAAERVLMERDRHNKALLERFVAGEISQEEYDAATSAELPWIDIEMVDDTGDEEVKEVEEIAGRAEREKTAETLGGVESKSTTGKKKEKAKAKATGKPKHPTTEAWWSSDLKVVRVSDASYLVVALTYSIE